MLRTKIYQKNIKGSYFTKKVWPKVIWISSRSLEEKITKSVFGSYVYIIIKHWNLLNHTKAAFVQRSWYDFIQGFLLRASSRFLEEQVQNSCPLNQEILKVSTSHKDCICIQSIYWFKTKVFWVSSVIGKKCELRARPILYLWRSIRSSYFTKRLLVTWTFVMNLTQGHFV